MSIAHATNDLYFNSSTNQFVSVTVEIKTVDTRKLTICKWSKVKGLRKI